jgi:glycosyltransferase involved in cell wall biosynthesis/2-polyprenyl-3-methyl-5-hydroxy-6-metoxy-1,4-benzoquinol methylase
MIKRKILLIGVLPPPINGQALAFQALVNEMDVEILIISGKRNTNSLVTLTKVFNYFGILFKLIFKLISRKYVVYHTISQSKEGFIRDFPIVFISKILGSKVVVHIHGGNYDGFYYAQKPFIQKQINKMLIMTDSIVILSKGLSKMFDFAPKLKFKIKVVQNGLPWCFEDNQLNFKALPINPELPIKIIFLSNLIESKGYLDVLEATSLLVNEYGYNVKTDFCGEFIQYDDAQRSVTLSEAKQYFHEFITKNNLKNHVNYNGVVEVEKKKELLTAAHFFVLPTNYINEGQPISIIEAMAYGCVVLTTDYRGISDMITIYESGVYVKYNNPKEIAFEIHNLIQYPSEYQRISRNAHENYLRNYTKKVHLKTLINEIESHIFQPKNAIDFHSDTAVEFDGKYGQSSQFQHRFEVWTTLFEQYLNPEMKVLDAGCGSGIFSIYLALKKCIVLGIDGSEKMIELCKKYSQAKNLEISFQRAILPFENIGNFEKQDAILCSSVLEYITDYEIVIQQFKELLNPRGILIISMPNKDSWYRKIEKYIFKFTGKPPYYQYIQHILTEKDFSKRLKYYGFELQKLTYYPNTTIFSRLLKLVGVNEKNTNTMFVGVYKLL